MAKLSDEMKQLVERQRLGFVATICPDGTPSVSPKGTVSILDDEHLIFADIRSPGTVSNLRTNPNVEVNVVDHFIRKGYRFKGTAQVLDAPGRIRAIVTIHVDHARPLISPGYDHVPDEATARAYWLKYYVGETGAG